MAIMRVAITIVVIHEPSRTADLLAMQDAGARSGQSTKQKHRSASRSRSSLFVLKIQA